MRDIPSDSAVDEKAKLMEVRTQKDNKNTMACFCIKQQLMSCPSTGFFIKYHVSFWTLELGVHVPSRTVRRHFRWGAGKAFQDLASPFSQSSHAKSSWPGPFFYFFIFCIFF